jgi:hypothetical protein
VAENKRRWHPPRSVTARRNARLSDEAEQLSAACREPDANPMRKAASVVAKAVALDPVA